MNEFNTKWYVIGIVLGIFMGAAPWSCITEWQMEKKAIQHEAAYYDKETGEFTWNNSDND